MPEHPYMTLAITGHSEDLRVTSFRSDDGISRLFEITVEVVTDTAPDFGLLSSLVRKKAVLTNTSPVEAERYVARGIVARVEGGNTAATRCPCRVTLVPWAWLLTHRVDTRIFQAKTTPKIVEEVLTGAGFASGTDFKMSLQDDYPTREYCVQYRESDWDFVSRLLEEDGIHYRFDQTDDGHVLVLADKASAYAAIDGGPLVFRADTGALVPAADHVRTFQLAEEVHAGKVTLNDYAFEKPALALEATKSGKADTDLAVYDPPGRYELPADGDTRAEVRLGELRATAQSGAGTSNCPRIAAGKTFTLSEHPTDAFNAKYVVTRVIHTGRDAHDQADAEDNDLDDPRYANDFDVIPAEVLFRPPRVTRRPQIHGVQTAVVVGPQGEEIYVDQYGRVKVQFHWDRLGKKDDKSSCWIRVARPWASQAYGAMFIPRVEDEVVVAFLEGDPDRPLIVGSVYHGTNVVPYTLPDDKTRTTIKSHSSPAGRRVERAPVRGQEGERGDLPPRAEGLGDRRRARQEPEGRPRRDARGRQRPHRDGEAQPDRDGGERRRGHGEARSDAGGRQRPHRDGEERSHRDRPRQADALGDQGAVAHPERQAGDRGLEDAVAQGRRRRDGHLRREADGDRVGRRVRDVPEQAHALGQRRQRGDGRRQEDGVGDGRLDRDSERQEDVHRHGRRDDHVGREHCDDQAER
jgi:type VI secretion system secreted protein VgrG